jgi:PAS domain S-box-containing protein
MACELLGYTYEELMSMTVDQVETPEEAQRVPDRLARLMANGHLAFETVHQHKDGSPIPIEARTRLINWEGQPAMMSIGRDITERKRAEEELAKYREHLEELVEERTKELTKKISELEIWHDATINRELRMEELRVEIKKLKAQINTDKNTD